MPDVEEKKTVDIDTSGPGADIELPEEEQESNSVEVSNDKVEESVESNDSPEKSDEKPAVQADENKTEEDKELEQYSKDVKRRIAKLTGKWREAERQKDEALTYAERMIIAKKKAEAKLSKLEPGYLKSTEDSIVSGMQAAQAKLAAAREAQDLAAEAEALTAISELGYKKAKFEEAKIAQEEYNKKLESKPSPDINLERKPAAQGTPDPKAEDWASKNAWFGQDTAMTYTAFDLHKKLTEDEGYDPSSDEYYTEIDKRIRLEFPHKFDRKDPTETTKPVQTVASAKRTTKTGRRTVKLTPSQVAIAKKLGVPLEEYAKQLNITKEV